MRTKIAKDGIELTGLERINVILGKNGCGKSTLLRNLAPPKNDHESARTANELYIPPERGGETKFNANTENHLTNDYQAILSQTRNNYFYHFRELTVSKFGDLMFKILEKYEQQNEAGAVALNSRSSVLEEMNKLQDRIEVCAEGRRPTFRTKDGINPVTPGELSSGEKEIFCVAVDLLHFEYTAPDLDKAIVLIDEPDVHVHPDMQARLGKLIADIAVRTKIQFLIATHSTAFIAGMAHVTDLHVSFMGKYQVKLAFQSVTERLASLLPVFGAHPLSSLFLESPLLLVEGPDDEWMWRQACRSSNGRIKVNPVAVGGKPNMHAYEVHANELLVALYENPRAYSIRDGDGIDDEIEPLGSIIRLRFAAQEAENFLLSDEVLEEYNCTWPQFQDRLEVWLTQNEHHQSYATLSEFKNKEYDRANADIKAARLTIADLLGSNKPIPVILGKAIAKNCIDGYGTPEPTSLKGMMGKSTYTNLFDS